VAARILKETEKQEKKGNLRCWGEEKKSSLRGQGAPKNATGGIKSPIRKKGPAAHGKGDASPRSVKKKPLHRVAGGKKVWKGPVLLYD